MQLNMEHEAELTVARLFSLVQYFSLPCLEEIVLKLDPQSKFKLANSYNQRKETPLLVAINRGHVSIVRFLVNNMKANAGQTGRFKWKKFYCEETPPLLAAIVSNQGGIVQFFTTDSQVTIPKLSYDAVISSSMSRLDKINALELMGASFIFAQTPSQCHQLGLFCWKEAMKLRLPINNDEQSLQKCPVQLSDRLRQATGNVEEVTTIEQIDNLEGDRDRQLEQALIVNHRIFSETTLISDSFILNFWNDFIVNCFKGNQFEKCIDAALFLFEHLHSLKWTVYDIARVFFAFPVNPITNAIQYSVYSIKRIALKSYFQPDANFLKRIKLVVDFIYYYDQQVEKTDVYQTPNRWTFHVIKVLFQFRPNINDENRQFYNEILNDLVGPKKRWGNEERTLLHWICSTVNFGFETFDMTHILLNLGVDPNAVDINKDTALHYLSSGLLLASNLKIYSDEFYGIIATMEMVMDAGGIIDQVNRNRLSTRDHLKKLLVDCPSLKNDVSFQSLINKCHVVLTLMNLCGRVIRQHRINTQILPLHLQSLYYW